MKADDESLAKFFEVWPQELVRVTLPLITARKEVEEAVQWLTTVATLASDAGKVGDYAGLGTPELPAAMSEVNRVAGTSEVGLHEIEAAARQVAQAFTATPTQLIGKGLLGVELGAAVIMLRAALASLDEAVKAADDAGLSWPRPAAGDGGRRGVAGAATPRRGRISPRCGP